MIIQYLSETRSVTTGTYGNRNCEYGLMYTQEIERTGGWRVSTNLNTSEGDLFPVLGDEERPSRVLVIQHGSQLEDLQILVTNVLDGGNDPQLGYLDLVGGSRERNLKTGGGANHGLGISTEGCKIKSEERQREHGDGKVRATGLRLGVFQPRHLTLFIPPGTRDSVVEL